MLAVDLRAGFLLQLWMSGILVQSDIAFNADDCQVEL